ncbi:hypothetical protein EN781_22675 [Mesorhizobium sp. M4A.F.Ca.ET.090.04.2.1]|nr:hypothetical protein EN781_22675 [Mesorhizobium sp. M4A.F.Ca.ET.090.04.2.1]
MLGATTKQLISPLVGEMAGRPEGGAKERRLRLLQTENLRGRRRQPLRGWRDSAPPLSCRTSPPQGGRLAVATAFANHCHPAVRAICKSTNCIPFCANLAHSDSASSSR